MQNTPYMIGIAGGSGSGKTTIATELQKSLPNSIILHLDSFQKIGSKPETVNGIPNWDHPSYIDWDELIACVIKLKNREQVQIKQWDQHTLTKYHTEVLTPDIFIIVEGYLLFFHPKVRELLDLKVYLEAPDTTRINRRTKLKTAEYVENILLPMHEEHVVPTKMYANQVLNTDTVSVNEVVKEILNHIPDS